MSLLSLSLLALPPSAVLFTVIVDAVVASVVAFFVVDMVAVAMHRCRRCRRRRHLRHRQHCFVVVVIVLVVLLGGQSVGFDPNKLRL